MDARGALIEEARHFGDIETSRIGRLGHEREQLLARLAELDEALELAISAASRAQTFDPRDRIQPECPRCWVVKGIVNRLRNIPGTDTHDVWRCSDGTCRPDFDVPIDK